MLRSWSVADGTAGGCTNFPSVERNPMYLLTVEEDGTEVVINLAQEDTRCGAALACLLPEAGGSA